MIPLRDMQNTIVLLARVCIETFELVPYQSTTTKELLAHVTQFNPKLEAPRTSRTLALLSPYILNCKSATTRSPPILRNNRLVSGGERNGINLSPGGTQEIAVSIGFLMGHRGKPCKCRPFRCHRRPLHHGPTNGWGEYLCSPERGRESHPCHLRN